MNFAIERQISIGEFVELRVGRETFVRARHAATYVGAPTTIVGAVTIELGAGSLPSTRIAFVADGRSTLALTPPVTAPTRTLVIRDPAPTPPPPRLDAFGNVLVRGPNGPEPARVGRIGSNDVLVAATAPASTERTVDYAAPAPIAVLRFRSPLDGILEIAEP